MADETSGLLSQAAAKLAATTQTIEQVSNTAFDLIDEITGVVSTSVWRVGRETISLAAHRGVPEEYIFQWRLLDINSEIPAARVGRTGKALYVEDEASFAAVGGPVYTLARASNRIWTFAVLPLITGPRTIGVLAISFKPVEHRFEPQERAYLEKLADICKQALERVRFFEV